MRKHALRPTESTPKNNIGDGHNTDLKICWEWNFIFINDIEKESILHLYFKAKQLRYLFCFNSLDLGFLHHME